MKRRILLSVIGAVLVMGLASKQAKAQTFVASFGVQQSWGVPINVVHYIDDHYYGYEWVHTRQLVSHGVVDFQIVLQRGPVFLEITLDRFGRVYRTVRRDYYPLVNHVCGPSCGYHANYYRAHYVTCSGHNHYGHNHVKYYRRPRGNAYGYYKNGNHHAHQNDRDYDHKYKDDRRGDHGNGYGKGHDHGKGNGGRYTKGNGNGRGNAGRYNTNGRSGSVKSANGSTNYRSGGRSNASSNSSRVRGAGRN